MTTQRSRESLFLDLVDRVQGCQKCPRMNGSARVLGLGCGTLGSKVMFVGEAPGRLGADGSHLPFHGDKAGHNFETLIEQVGISRYQVFVTNAVLCNPKDEAGNNSTPTAIEIANCAPFLKEQIELLKPTIVVTLGATALKACALVEPHTLSLNASVRTKNRWFGRALVPMYHPGQRAMLHRSFANQLADYQFVAESMRRTSNKKRRSVTATGQRSGKGSKLAQIAQRIIERRPAGLSYFALHKLYFLAEVVHLEETGERLTNSYVVRQKDGPYCVDLHIAKLSTMIPEILISRRVDRIELRFNAQLGFEDSAASTQLSAKEADSIDRTIARYGNLSDTDLKRVTYLSAPMRRILKKEKALSINLFNSAVLPYTERASQAAASGAASPSRLHFRRGLRWRDA